MARLGTFQRSRPGGTQMLSRKWVALRPTTAPPYKHYTADVSVVGVAVPFSGIVWDP